MSVAVIVGTFVIDRWIETVIARSEATKQSISPQVWIASLRSQ
jgi:hypothetical protein